MRSWPSVISLLTPAIELMFSASKNEFIKSIIVCVASGTTAIISLKKSSITGASVALIAVVALPIDEVINVNVVERFCSAAA